MTRRGTNISLKSYEDIFTTEEKRQEQDCADSYLCHHRCGVYRNHLSGADELL